MATVHDTIHAVLGDDPTVAGLVGDRIYPGQIPAHDEPSPFVYYLLTEEESTDGLDGPTTGLQGTLEVDCVAETIEEMHTLKSAVLTALYGYRGGQVASCIWRTGTEIVEGDGSQFWYRGTLVFGVRGSSAPIVPSSLALPRVVVTAEGLFFDGRRIAFADEIPSP